MRKKGLLGAMSLVLLVLLGAALALTQTAPEPEADLSRSPGVGAMCLTIRESSWAALPENKENIAPANVKYLPADGTQEAVSGRVTIHGHGNSSWIEDKRSWTLSFSEPVGLLETKSARKYCLIAGARDTTYLRNKMAYQMAKKYNPEWSPDCELTEVFINGEYLGLYSLVERPHEANGVLISDAAAGSFFVEYHDPGYRDPTISEQFIIKEQNGVSSEGIYQKLGAVDRALRSADGIDAESGKAWDELVDIDSFARLYLINEVLGNTDATCTSMYFYCKGDGDEKLYAGPVWDFDRTCGIQKAETDIFVALQRHHEQQDEPWYRCLYEKPEFYQRMCQLYREEYLPQAEAFANGGLAAQAAEIAEAVARDQSKWGYVARELVKSGQILGGTMDAEAVQEWLKKRIDFLDRCWIDQEDLFEEVPMTVFNEVPTQEERYVSVGDVGLWGWIVQHKLLVEAAVVCVCAGSAFIAMLVWDYRRCRRRG